jgi:hypothetical protein
MAPLRDGRRYDQQQGETEIVSQSERLVGSECLGEGGEQAEVPLPATPRP